MRNLTQALTLTSMATAVRSAFKIASVNPVLWWDAESHRAGLAGGAATLYQDSGGTSAVGAVEQPVGRAVDRSGNARPALQTTSTARPILTARKNFLTYSEQFENAAWSKSGCVATGGVVSETAGNGQHRILQIIAVTSGNVYSISCEVERISGSRHFMLDIVSGTNGYCYFDLDNGTHLLAGAGMSNVSVVSDVAGKYKISANFTASAASMVLYVAMCSSKVLGGETYTADGSGVLSVARFQIEPGLTATSYQRVTTATDYDTTAAPLMLQFDGADDELGTAPFAAGTMPANADVYLLMRRAANDGQAVLIYQPGGASRYAGVLGGSGSASNAGAPTYAVNGVAVPGGSTPSNSVFAAAVGHEVTRIVEVRNANLSTWTRLGVGLYGYGYNIMGQFGAILITPAQSDATRAKIRKALAKAYQITGVV
ncbi:phage head spike fiber domain-containing protein [Limnohabitans lacus]|uniref:Phage tail protein n=1 Tax=Limnohabitans lacus TaxID=3045173 RepID=A0ABT6X872_9BURK|nr:hypothetical protein [Limnohabitans sp. HM2-2]MDI9234325.1 hypothetical protein [Limnohabitans sp. HM2-2]